MLKFSLLLLFFCQVFLAKCEEEGTTNVKDEGISLAFVIDDTGSMAADIHQVKEQVDSIFNAALKSNGSRIKDFILYTFNDPTTKFRTKTLDRELFKKELADIVVDGGGDCPEMALTGLEEALKLSRKGSIVYLFTDADAKDYEKYEAVKKLAKEKEAKLNFILTGTCYGSTNNDSPDHRVYFKLADDTQGEVFSLFKQEVGEILNYARASVGAAAYSAVPPAVLYSADVPESTNEVEFTVTEGMKEVLISVTGSSPAIHVTDPEGNTPKWEDVALTSGATVLKVLDTKPGKYKVTVVSGDVDKVVITGINASGESSKIVE